MDRGSRWGKRVWEALEGFSTGSSSLVTTPKSYYATGTVSANGDTVELICPDCQSGELTISGTFDGRVTLTGTITETSVVEGGRLLFRSGVGSTGRNYVRTTGGSREVSQEYRFIPGGERIILRASEWTSGSLTIELRASPAQTNIFLNGPVHTAEEEATRDARGYIASTGVLSVAAGNIIIATLSNPTDNSNNLFVKSRTFANNRSPTDDNLEFIGYANPTYVPTTLGNIVNRRAGGNPSSAVFRSEARSIVGLTIGGIMGRNQILPNGVPYNLDFDFIIPPGNSLGLVIAGEGNNLANAVRIGLELRWYEEATF